MKLYHVSLNLKNVEEFIPRVPSEESRIDGEDDKTPRICLSQGLRGCLTAVPWGGNSFEDLFFDNGKSQLIRVYEFDSNDIVEGNIVYSHELYKTDRVRDAKITGEVWVINQNLKPINSYVIQINDYQEGSEDDISYEDMKNFDEDEDNIEDIINGCFTTIDYIQYDVISEDSISDEVQCTFKVTGSSDDDKDTISEYFEEALYNICIGYNININYSDKDKSFLVDLEVDLTEKPTTKENFLNIINYDLSDLIDIEVLS